MKKYLGPIIVFASVLVAVCLTDSCKKAAPPATCFATLPDSAYVGQSLVFTSCTVGASSYLWTFGDGSTASTDSAKHTYTAPGIYNGSLTTSNGQGSTKTFTIVVTRPVDVWTFQGITDSSSYAQAVGGDTLQATNFTGANMTNVSNIVFIFSALPAAAGSYQVINDQFATPSAGQVAVYLTTPSKFYGSTGNDHSTATVTLAGGKIKVTIPTVEMVNLSTPTDSAVLSATITQTE
jgi:hypothetical protein